MSALRTMPAVAGLLAGLLLAVPLPGQERPLEALILSPDPGERVAQGSVLVTVSFVDPDARLDPTSIVLRVGGRDVTHEAAIGAHTVQWRPTQPLEPGLQRVVLTARDRDGVELPPTGWSFTVARAADVEPLDPTAPADPRLPGWAPSQGSITLESVGQTVSGPGSDLRRDESFVPRLWVNASGTIRPGWRYSTRIHMSGYESSSRQPVNRFRVDVRSDHLNASVGDVNPSFQDVILAGRRVRGFQAQVERGPARLGLVWGQSRRAIDGQLDPTDPTRIFRRGTYGQSLFALRPSVGSGERFQAGLTFLRARDDVTSIPEVRTELPGDEGGSTRSVNPLPKDNLVLGADLAARFLDGRVLVQYENGFSLLANDISGGPLTEAQLDSIMEAAGYEPLGWDPSRFERFFIMNASMIPLDPRGLNNMAHQLRSTVRAGSHMISLEWRSIGGAYHTLGYPALQRDLRGFRIRDSFTVLDNALSLSAGIERDRDNLDDVKPATTTSTGLFADATWHPSRDRVTVTGSFRLGTRSNDLQAGRDGARDEESRAFSVGISYPVDLLEDYRTHLNLNVSVVNRDDDANPRVGSRNVFYMGGIQAETMDRRSEYSLIYGLNRSELTGFDNAETSFHRATANVRHQIAPQWAATLDGTITLARSPEEAQELGLRYNRTELLAGGEWEWTPTSFLSFSAGVVSFTDEQFPDRDTREILTRLRVNRGF